MFRKGNSKIYNFPVEDEFKFTPEGAQNSSIDPERNSTEPVDVSQGAAGRRTRATESVEVSPTRWKPVETVLIGGHARWEFHRLGGGTTEPVRRQIARGTRRIYTATDSVDPSPSRWKCAGRFKKLHYFR